MNWRNYVFLGLCGFLVSCVVAQFQSAPDYPDADYYYAGGLQLVSGNGFSEPYLWNFLDDPISIPHPSFGYWMPMASFLTAGSAWLFGLSWMKARVGFLILAGLLPPLSAALAFSISERNNDAWIAGLLAVFSGYYVVFLPITDTFGLYMFFGGLFFLIYGSQKIKCYQKVFLLGLLAGFMHLTRVDGFIWLFVSIMAAVFLTQQASTNKKQQLVWFFFLTVMGYCVVMVPWFIRNQIVFGSFLAPGGARVLWLTSYNQLFTYPASKLTFISWWQSGILTILRVRLIAFWINLQSVFAVQGGIFLFPLLLVGIWQLRNDRRIQLAMIAWGLMIILMSLIFPFAGVRGGYFHSGSALQLFFWAIVPIGFESAMVWLGKRWKKLSDGHMIERLRLAIVFMTLLFTALIFFRQVYGSTRGERGWGSFTTRYQFIDWFLASKGQHTGDVVIVANPPGYFLASGQPAIAIPEGDFNVVLELAEQFDAKYLILEPTKLTEGLLPIYELPETIRKLVYLGEVGGARVFSIQP
jgi:hypothetical protein